MPKISASYGSSLSDDSESHTLLHKPYARVQHSYNRDSPSSGSGLWIKFAIIMLSMFTTLLVITWAIDALPNETLRNVVPTAEMTRSTGGASCIPSYAAVHLQASNEYGVFNAPYPWLMNSNNTDLVEPFKATNLTLLELPQQACLGFEYLWRISYRNGSSLYVAHTSVPQLELTLTTVGVFSIVIISGKLQDFPSSLSSTSKAIVVYNGTIVSK